MAASALLKSEAVAQRCSVKNVFLEISQDSLENTCFRISFLTKLQACNFVKKRLWHKCFPVNFARFLRTFFSHSTPPVAASVK